MFNKVAVMGDVDLVFPLKALGIKIYTPKNIYEAREMLKRLETEGIALCLVNDKFFAPLKKEIDKLEKKFCPVVASFSDYREASDLLSEKLKDLAIKATGSDSLIRRK